MKNNIEKLFVDNKKIKTQKGQEKILCGVSIADPEALNNYVRGRFLNLHQIMEIAVFDFRVNVIRLPVHPYGIDDQPGWISNPESYLKNHLDKAINKSIELDIYVIIDLHLICDYTSDEINKLVTSFWTQIAPIYSDYPNVIYELFNEPLYPDDWNKWKEIAQPWIDLIRKYAPDTLLLVGGPRWCQNMSGAAKNPFSGKNIVYSAHCYPDHLRDFNKNWGDLVDKYPVFFTEWGYENPGKTPWQGTTSGFGEPFMKIINEKKLSWCAWCFDSDWPPRIFDRKWQLFEDKENYMSFFTKELLKEARSKGENI
jgi:endoglucanase